MVERSLCAIIDLLQRTKSLFLYFKWRVGGWFSLKISSFREKKIHFILFHLIFLCYYCCSINPKRQSEYSGLRPDTNSLVLNFQFFLSLQKIIGIENTSNFELKMPVFSDGVKTLSMLKNLKFVVKFDGYTS